MTSVDQFISRQDKENRELIEALRKLIWDAEFHIQERMAHGIPFYYYLGPLCYINPADDGVDLGFCRGALLSNSQGLLEAKDRVEVRTIRVTSLSEFPVDALRELLQEAILFNEWYDKQKKN